MIFQDEFELQTDNHGDLQDITEPVEQIVKQSGIRTGIAHIFNVGSTASIGTIEFEPGLKRDLPELFDRLIPRAVIMAMSRLGMMGMVILIFRPPGSGQI
jgi:thiamine phosphate synthase YjbQ (UPF0047 family)